MSQLEVLFKQYPEVKKSIIMKTEAMQKLLERFKDCPRVINIFKTIGGYNLIALVLAENQDTLESISVSKFRRSLFCSQSLTTFHISNRRRHIPLTISKVDHFRAK